MRRHLSRWHRRIGLISLALLTWLAITGVLLNHSHRLGLDKPIGQAWVAQWYGIEADCQTEGWILGSQTLIDCSGLSLLDGQVVPELEAPVRGALPIDELFVIASEDGILLLLPSGERVEWLPAEFLPGRPLRLGRLSGSQNLVLQTPAGVFSSDEALLDWQSVPTEAEREWSQSQRLDEEALREARLLAAVQRLSWTKLLQDLHSGRIIGLPGTLLADLGALSILILAFLGLALAGNVGRKPSRQAKAPADAERDDTPSV